MAAVTCSIFMPRPGSRVTERNSGLLPLLLGFPREGYDVLAPDLHGCRCSRLLAAVPFRE